MSILSDELLLELLSHLGPADLTRAGSASKALYCYCRHDEVWKALVLQVGLVKVCLSLAESLFAILCIE